MEKLIAEIEVKIAELEAQIREIGDSHESQRQQGALDAYMHMLDEIREAPQPMITTR